MSAPVLQTKLYFPPARSNLVPCPQLLECLKVGLSGPLTLIAAPAGYGKTTLMSEWRVRHGRDMSIAWLSLDENDNELASFWFYLVSALDTLQPSPLENTLPLLASPNLPPVETLLTFLINDLSAFPRDFVLALDDVHLLTTPEIYRGIDFLLEHLPPHMHLVLLTRADPPLALSRVRARGQPATCLGRGEAFSGW